MMRASNATYVGLTQPMYDSGLYDFAQLAPDDNLAIRRYSGSVNHHYFFTDNLQLLTTAFAYTTNTRLVKAGFHVNTKPNMQHMCALLATRVSALVEPFIFWIAPATEIAHSKCTVSNLGSVLTSMLGTSETSSTPA
jgi:outer membrane receptor for Fe3+-dicitrate